MTRLGIVSVTMMAAALGGCSASSNKVTAPPPPPVIATGTVTSKGEIAQVNTVQVTAIVVDVNARRRRVTLRGPDGKIETIRVSSEVQNLPQVRRGDQVVLTYVEALAIQLRKKGSATPSVIEDTAAERAARGQMPGAAEAQSVTVVAKITAIDRKAQTVTLKGPEGRTATVKVRNPANLEKARVGDLVEATYIEAVAISVERPSATR